MAAIGTPIIDGQPVDADNPMPVTLTSGGGASALATSKATPGTSSATALAANADRTGATIKNAGSVTVYLNFGAPATTNGFPLDQGDTLELGGYAGSVTGIVASGTGDLRCIEETSA